MEHQECMEAMAAEKYILGELSEVERDEFEEHCFSCSECAETVRCLSQLTSGVRAGLESPLQSTQPREAADSWLTKLSTWWLRPQAAFAGTFAALALAGVTGYQNLQMRAHMGAQTVESVALQLATRGDIPVVRTNPAGAFVLLEADLPGASGNLTWNLRADADDGVLHGTAPAPQPGLSFKLLLPAAALHASEYTLTVRSDAAREWLFRFRTGAR
jgi:hypothetical protein